MRIVCHLCTLQKDAHFRKKYAEHCVQLFLSKWLYLIADNTHSLFFLYRYPVYKARKQLAAIDWNYHKDLPACQSNAYHGEVMVTRKYNQRTKSWDSKIIKKEKDYTYVKLMVAKTLDKRMCDNKSILRRSDLDENDPKRISSTIAHVEPEPSRDIHKKKLSRFQSNSTD